MSEGLSLLIILAGLLVLVFATIYKLCAPKKGPTHEVVVDTAIKTAVAGLGIASVPVILLAMGFATVGAIMLIWTLMKALS